jgi:hypothetical protein
MKIENMKLLDLQTGKYLELGKDWHYCGNRIYLVGRLKECITSFNEFLRSQMKILDKYKEIDGQGNISYELAFKIATSDDECLNNAVDAQVDSGYVEKSEPQGILKTLCDKTGAVIYGDRYVLNPNYATIRAVIVNGGEHGFIYRLESLHQCKITNKCISLNEYLKYRPELVYAEKGYTEWYIYGNLFEEHSKQLRKEENKFDELMEKLK